MHTLADMHIGSALKCTVHPLAVASAQLSKPCVLVHLSARERAVFRRLQVYWLVHSSAQLLKKKKKKKQKKRNR